MRKKLIELREKNSMTQEEIASMVGISRSFYGHIENSKRNPSYGLAKKIASIFDLSVEDVFFDPESFRMKQNGNKTA